MKSLGWRCLWRIAGGVAGFWISAWSAHGEGFASPAAADGERPPQVTIGYEQKNTDESGEDALPPESAGEIASAPPAERELPSLGEGPESTDEALPEVGGLPLNQEAAENEGEPAGWL
jgi:hypothetical protein